MKKILPILLLVLFGKAHAQITIIAADMPVFNDTMRYSTTTSYIDTVSTGPNKVWDFSAIKIDNQDIQHYYSPLQTPYALFFYGASYGIPENNLALGVGGIASNVYGFYKNTTNSVVMLGRGATIQSLPLGITYSLKDTTYNLPLSYQNAFSGNFTGEASLVSLGTLKQVGNRTTVVDGWGSVTTPYGTFSCIRVKSVIREIDSIVFNGFSIPFPNNRVEYKWLAKNQKFPIMEVTVAQGATAGAPVIRFKDRYRPEAYVNNAKFTASKTSCQIGDTINLTNQSFGTPKTFLWTITPGSFRFVGGTTAATNNPRVIFDANGPYSVKLAITYEGGFDDTLKSNYIMVNELVKAAFGVNKRNVTPDEIVYFSDSSTGIPSSWLWTFTPATVVYVGGTSSMSQNPQVIFSSSGSYTVQLKATNSVGSNTLSKPGYIVVWPTGIQTYSKNEAFVKIYPNPGKDFLHILFTRNDNASIQISNLTGQLLLSAESGNFLDNCMDISTLSKGVYFIKIFQNNNTFIQRLIIE